MRAMIHWYRAAFRYPPPERQVTHWITPVPVLILWGEEDRFFCREMAEESLRYCAAGRCVRLPGISHWTQHEEPERVSESLLAHFAARPYEGSTRPR